MVKKILITGGSGFIGSHLTRKLLKLGHKVAITTKYKSIIDNVRIIDIWSKVKVIETDLRNLDSFDNLKKFNPDIEYVSEGSAETGDATKSLSVNFFKKKEIDKKLETNLKNIFSKSMLTNKELLILYGIVKGLKNYKNK